MTIGVSLFVIALGAILRWGISVAVEGANLEVIGLILMVIGVAGLVLGSRRAAGAPAAAAGRVRPPRGAAPRARS